MKQKPEKIVVQLPWAPKSGHVQKFKGYFIYWTKWFVLENTFKFQAVVSFIMNFDQVSERRGH